MARGVSSIIHGLLASSASAREGRLWQPPVDVYRVSDGWLLKFELAGVALKDVTTMLQGSQVIVRGVRLDRCLESGCSIHRMEIAYNWFERVVELPEDLSDASLSSEYSNGMLLLRIARGPAT
jgi:HSP20 family protein